MPATGVRAPARTLVAVRAIAPVAGRPPNSGETMLATPWATSSTFGLWRSPVMRSATTADMQRLDRAQQRHRQRRRQEREHEVGAERRDVRAPATRPGCRRSASRSSRPAGPARPRPACPPTRTTIAPGTRGMKRRQQQDGHQARRPRATRRRRQRGPAPRRSPRMRAEELAGHVLDRQAEEVLDLRGGDEHGDAVGEADDDRPRDELHRRAEPGEPEHDQHHAGHHRAHEQAVDAVLGDDPGDDDDERAGRPRHCRREPPSAETRKPAIDGAVDPGLGREARRDGERHRQRQRDQADGDAGHEVREEGSRAVAAQREEERGNERPRQRDAAERPAPPPGRAGLEPMPAHDDLGRAEVDHQAGDVDQRGDERRRGARRVEAQAAEEERQHRAAQRAPQHHAEQAHADA